MKSDLNESQLEMMRYTDGAMLVISVAGSGKTTGVMANLKNRFDNGEDLRKLFVTAFNKDAAEQIKKRISKFCNYSGDCSIGTSHSLFLRIQREAGLRYERIYPDWEIKKALVKVLKPFYSSGEEFSVYQAICFMKNALAYPMQIPNTDCFDRYQEIRSQMAEQCEIDANDLDKCFIEYETHKRSLNAIDMDDMLFGAYVLFMQDPDRLKRIQDRYTHLIVDEYQDINECQHQLFQLMTKTNGNIMAVGDDDQSIYAFRGASPFYIKNFATHYPGARIIKMSDNYRSQKLILDIANALIQNNRDRYSKSMRHTIEGDVRPYILNVVNDEHEAYTIASRINRYKKSEGSYQDVAILTRVNTQIPLIEIALHDQNIAYKTPEGASFFSRKEIVSIQSYLKLSQDPQNIDLIRGLANTPYRKIKSDTVTGWLTYNDFYASAMSSSFIETYLNQIEELKRKAKGNIASEVVRCITTGEIGMARWANNNASISSDVKPSVSMSILESMSENKTIDEILKRISDMQSFYAQNAGKEDVVSLTTIHRSKGLEWPYVFIPGFGGDLIPHKNNLDIEEERRLLYVAITRAIRGVALLRRKNDEQSLFHDEISDYATFMEVRSGTQKPVGTSG